MLKILFISANPRDTDKPLSIEKERTFIEEKIKAFENRYKFKNWDGVQAQDLLTVLSDFKPNILHFTGHASKNGVPVFLKMDDNGQLVPVDAFVRALSLYKEHIKCVILNACYTSPLAEKIAEHIKCVIGSIDSVHDPESLSFSPIFYYRILCLDRDSVGRAFEHAKVQVELVGGRDKIFEIHHREGENLDDLYLLPLDTKSLPPDIVNKISAFLVCYNSLGSETTPLKIWQDKHCGSLRSLLDIFQNNAKEYSLTPEEISFIDNTILYFLSNISGPTAELVPKFMECKKFFRRWVPDYDKNIVESTRYRYPTSEHDRIISIVHGFYETIDSVVDLKEAVDGFTHSYQEKRFIKTLVPRNRQVCKNLQGRLKTLYEDLQHEKKSGRSIWDESTWNEIVFVQKTLQDQMSMLLECFTNTEQSGTDCVVLEIMETTREELKRLWTKAIKNILYTQGGSDIVA